jgi:hypothetical protein
MNPTMAANEIEGSTCGHGGKDRAMNKVLMWKKGETTRLALNRSVRALSRRVKRSTSYEAMKELAGASEPAVNGCQAIHRNISSRLRRKRTTNHVTLLSRRAEHRHPLRCRNDITKLSIRPRRSGRSRTNGAASSNSRDR